MTAPPKRLQGRVAVITGSGRGIGREIALLMATEGASVVVNELGPDDGAAAVVREIEVTGASAVAQLGSVADRESADAIVRCAVDTFGRIDVLVNNAGIVRDRMIWNMSDEEWHDVVGVHLHGHFYCGRAAVQAMRAAASAGEGGGGRIINVTSTAGIYGNPGQPNYGAAKMGIIGLTYAMALSCGRYGITCNAIAPRAMTRITDTIPEDRLRELTRLRGMPEWDAPDIEDVKRALLGGPPASIAPLVCWLASEQAAHVNGRVLKVTEGAIGVYEPMPESKSAVKAGTFTVDDLDEVMRALVPPSADGQAGAGT